MWGHHPLSAVVASTYDIRIEGPSQHQILGSFTLYTYWMLATGLITISQRVPFTHRSHQTQKSRKAKRTLSSSTMDCYQLNTSASACSVDCILFDLDDTLYSSKCGISEALRKNIDQFLVEKCGFPEDDAPVIRSRLFKSYGSSLAGLRALGYDIDADEYHNFVHGRLPYSSIKPNSRLRSILLGISQRKIIFTNSDRAHAERALKRLGIEDCFEQIICFETMNPYLSQSTRPDEFPVVLKPSLDAMRIAVRVAKIDPRRTLFLDDNVHNVAAGKAVGLQTILVGKTIRVAGADCCLETVDELGQVLAKICVGGIPKDSQATGRARSQVNSFTNTAAVNA